MAGTDKKISDLLLNPSIQGTEEMPTERGGSNYKSTFAQLKAWVLDGLTFMEPATYDPNGVAADVYDRSNQTGTQPASTISDFDTEVANNNDVAANTAKRSYPSADETRLANTSGINTGDQDLSGLQVKPSEGAFVDGDKTKLDGIESGAEVNQTAAEIKTAYESNANSNAYTDLEKAKVANLGGTNSGDETTASIQAKRPLKTVNNTSLEGTGNIEILGGVETVNTLTGNVVLTAENVDTTATNGKTIKAEIDENPTATQLGRIKAVFDSNSGEFVMSIDGTDIT